MFNYQTSICPILCTSKTFLFAFFKSGKAGFFQEGPMPHPPPNSFVMAEKPFSLILASTHKGSIGKNGQLPWSIPEDLKTFSFITRSVSDTNKRNAVLMGRKTFESLPAKFKPLPDRLNVVISTTMKPTEICQLPTQQLPTQQLPPHHSMQEMLKQPFVVSSLDEALTALNAPMISDLIDNLFIIGGKRLFDEAVTHRQCQAIYLTRVQGKDIDDDCDVRVDFLDSLGLSSAISTPADGGGVQTFSSRPPQTFVPTFVSKTRSCGDVTYDFTKFERRPDKKLLGQTEKRSGTENRPVRGECGTRENSVDMNGVKSVLASSEYFKKENPLSLEKLQEFIDALDKAPSLSSVNEFVEVCPFVEHRGHEEFQYLDLIADIIRSGVKQDDRTGVGTLSKFGATMRFDLSQSFPLLTTKNVFWRGVVEELLWFVNGSTNSNELSQKGVKIWDANGSREFLDSRGFPDREVGDLGPVYGFQWRHFGASYSTMHEDYSGKGVDQLSQCIEELKRNPENRRIILSAWNPADVEKMALPPCHMFSQFFVTPDHKLSCLMYQRSADLGLGVPFNIASYSLLCLMMAQVTGLQPGEFIHVLGNAHVYLNHIEPLKSQLKRFPRPFPIVRLDKSIKEIDDFEAQHFTVIGYSPLPRIPMEMAV